MHSVCLNCLLCVYNIFLFELWKCLFWCNLRVIHNNVWVSVFWYRKMCYAVTFYSQNRNELIVIKNYNNISKGIRRNTIKWVCMVRLVLSQTTAKTNDTSGKTLKIYKNYPKQLFCLDRILCFVWSTGWFLSHSRTHIQKESCTHKQFSDPLLSTQKRIRSILLYLVAFISSLLSINRFFLRITRSKHGVILSETMMRVKCWNGNEGRQRQ